MSKTMLTHAQAFKHAEDHCLAEDFSLALLTGRLAHTIEKDESGYPYVLVAKEDLADWLGY